MRKKHSAIGIASFAVGMTTFVGIIGLFVVTAILVVVSQGKTRGNSEFFMLWNMAYLFSFFPAITGVLFGLADLLERERNRLFPVLGVFFSLINVTFLCGVIVFGESMKAGLR